MVWGIGGASTNPMTSNDYDAVRWDNLPIGPRGIVGRILVGPFGSIFERYDRFMHPRYEGRAPRCLEATLRAFQPKRY